ncbi:MAG: superoxide dismutase [Anaerolineaceae bacterium]
MSKLFELPPLVYAFNALEPAIDALTMEIHHDKHHAAYVANLNKAMENQPELQGKSIEALLKDLNAIPEVVRTAIRNNGGGHANHSLYWNILSPGGRKSPTGLFEKALLAEFDTLDKFNELLSNSGLTRFGSGWAWLVVDPAKKLKVYSTANQDSPLSQGDFPLLAMDVWEHAYYLKYQNRRADYINAFMSVVNWDVVSGLYEKAM